MTVAGAHDAMRTDLFDFELPAERIALRPASPRDSARMLVVQRDGVLRDRIVARSAAMAASPATSSWSTTPR